jgi:hypothetical protein
VDEIDEDALDGAGDQVQRAFAARARLAELNGEDELLDARLSVAMPLRFEHELNPGKRVAGVAEIELGKGTHHTVEVPLRMLELISSLDGKATLRDVVRNAAERREALEIIHELLELGALQFVDPLRKPR